MGFQGAFRNGSSDQSPMVTYAMRKTLLKRENESRKLLPQLFTSTLFQKTPPPRRTLVSSSSTSETRESHRGRPALRRALFERASAATDRPFARTRHCDRRLPG